MRTIKFRAKTLKGEWIYGYYSEFELCDGEGRCSYIKKDGRQPIKVVPETVGQFTGLTDKNGKEIYEGDIVKYAYSYGNTRINKVLFNNGCFIVDDDYILSKIGNVEVVGNIYDNHELLQPSDRINSIKEFFDMGGVAYYYNYSDSLEVDVFKKDEYVDIAYSYEKYNDLKYNCSIFPKFFIKCQEYILFVDTKKHECYLEKKKQQ